MKLLAALFFGFALLTLSSANDETPKTAQPATATCHVCRYNRDLACVEFRLKPTTPQIVYAGTSYCFCSEACRNAFVKNPAPYIPKTKSRTPKAHGPVPAVRS